MNKKGELTTEEIVGVVLGAAAVLVMAVFLYMLLSPGFDANKEYAKGVYNKLERAASEVESSGRSEFNILDVPVDYGDAVFLVLFKKGRASLVRYPVEIKNSDFTTYVEMSAGPLIAESRRVFYSTVKEGLVGAGVSESVADDVGIEAGKKIVDDVAVKSLENMNDFIFEVDMDYVVGEFSKRAGVNSDDVAKALKDVSFEGNPMEKMALLRSVLSDVAEKSGKSSVEIFWEIEREQIVKNFVTTSGIDKSVGNVLEGVKNVGKNLPYEEKVVALKSSLKKYLPDGTGKIGRYKDIDSFMNSARGLSKYNAMQKLSSEAGFNIQGQKLIGQSVGVDDVERAIKEFTDNTFAKGLSPSEKMVRLKSVVRKYAGDVGDDVFAKVDAGLGGKEAMAKTLGVTTADVSDDAVKMAVDRIVAVKSIPIESEMDEIIEGAVKKTLKETGKVADDVADDVAKKVVVSSTKKSVRLASRISFRVVGAAFVIWEAYDYYKVAQNAQAAAIVALNDEKVSLNDWVATKFLKTDREGDVLCVCYVDDGYKKNHCVGCVDFGKPIVANPDKNRWTFCENIVLEDKGDSVLLSSYVKEDCKPSIAFTNDECEESKEALKVKLGGLKNELVGRGEAIARGLGYGMLMGEIGGLVGGGVGLLFGGVGVAPGVILGAQWGAALGVAMGGVAAYEGVDFSCDEKGHIYLGESTE